MEIRNISLNKNQTPVNERGRAAIYGRVEGFDLYRGRAAIYGRVEGLILIVGFSPSQALTNGPAFVNDCTVMKFRFEKTVG